mgnify:CR=1 FL=1
MKFMITRTSNYGDEERPCDDSRLTFEKYDYVEVRTCTEDEFNKRFSHEGAWRSKGIKHTTCNNGMYIQRTFPKKMNGWFIEFDTLEEFIEFKKKIAYELVVRNGLFNRNILCIEIYDTYRE